MAEIMKKLAMMKKPMIAIPSGANLTLGTRPFLRQARKSGCQQILRTVKFVVPAKAGTQEQAAEIPGFPLSRE
jgi:hypothetical protein